MYCKHCGTKNLDLAKFCKDCGKEISHIFKKSKNRKRLWYIAMPVVAIIIVLMINSGGLNIYPFWTTSPKTETLKCHYAGKDLQVDAKLYGNISNYYSNLPNQDDYIKNQDYSKFVYSNPKDKTIKELANKISYLANSYKLNGDQSMELAACFVQNIPYDNEAFDQIKSTGNTAQTEQFPYETLYNNKGVCTDKTYLGSALLGAMGYGTSIMLFPNDSHMSLGITVPSGYTSFNSNYAIMDVTTPGFTPGAIPATVPKNNGVPNPNIKNINSINENDNPDSISLDLTKEIGAPSKVISVNNGKSYMRIVAVKNLEKEITNLVNSLDGKKSNLQKAKSNISYLDSQQQQIYNSYLSMPSTTQTCYPVYTYYPYYSSYQNCSTSANYSKNLKYNSYTTAFNNYKNSISYYNQLVNDYNNTLENINNRIDIYKSYEY